jgi:hypothetical protein
MIGDKIPPLTRVPIADTHREIAHREIAGHPPEGRGTRSEAMARHRSLIPGYSPGPSVGDLYSLREHCTRFQTVSFSLGVPQAHAHAAKAL